MNNATLRKFSIKEAFEYIRHVPIGNITFILEATRLNGTLSQEGRRKPYGLNLSGVLTTMVNQGFMSDDISARVLIETVAASDARMGGTI